MHNFSHMTIKIINSFSKKEEWYKVLFIFEGKYFIQKHKNNSGELLEPEDIIDIKDTPLILPKPYQIECEYNMLHRNVYYYLGSGLHLLLNVNKGIVDSYNYVYGEVSYLKDNLKFIDGL